MTHTNVTVHVTHVISLVPISSYILNKQDGSGNLPDPVVTESDLRYLRAAEPGIGTVLPRLQPGQHASRKGSRGDCLLQWTHLSPNIRRDGNISAIDGRT